MRLTRSETAITSHCTRKSGIGPGSILAFFGLAALAGTLLAVGCSSEKADTEPTVTVQVAAVEKTTIQHTIKTQAILFPRQQAAIVPKISAPVQKLTRLAPGPDAVRPA